MMLDVDALSPQYSNLIGIQLRIDAYLKTMDKESRPLAHQPTTLHSYGIKRKKLEPAL